jgi:hypothetical protein
MSLNLFYETSTVNINFKNTLEVDKAMEDWPNVVESMARIRNSIAFLLLQNGYE